MGLLRVLVWCVLLSVLCLCISNGVSASEDESSSSSSSLSESDFKVMKIAQLKAFLHERGVACTGCSEKAEYVATALQHRDSPLVSPSASASPSSSPSSSSSSSSSSDKSDKSQLKQEQSQAKAKSDKANKEDKKKKSSPSSSSSSSSSKGGRGSFGSTWELRALRMCNTIANTKFSKLDKQITAAYCGRLAKVVEKRFSTMSQGLFSALGKSGDRTLKTSLSEPFKTAGENALRSWLNEAFDLFKQSEYNNDSIDDEKLGDSFGKSKMSKWLLDTMMEKKEAMFGGDDLEEMIRKFKLNEQPPPPPPKKEQEKQPESEYDEHVEL